MCTASFAYHTGPPSAPVVELTQSHLINDFIYNHLSWSAPFTFQGFPITNYSITKFNHFNRESTTINRMASFTDYSYQSISQGDHCYKLDFTVRAVNRLGSSPPTVIHTGHPIGKLNDISNNINPRCACAETITVVVLCIENNVTQGKLNSRFIVTARVDFQISQKFSYFILNTVDRDDT
jgi:hypothetical protein